MSKLEKLLNELKTNQVGFKYIGAVRLLNSFGLYENNKGKTSGSRVKFYRESDGLTFLLHRPHPGDCLKVYAAKQLLEFIESLEGVNYE